MDETIIRGKQNRGVICLGISLLFLFLSLSILFPVMASAQAIPNCDKTARQLLSQVPIPQQLKDLRDTLVLADEIVQMSDNDIFTNLDAIGNMIDGIDADKLINQLKNLDRFLNNPSIKLAGTLGGLIDHRLAGQGLQALDAQLRKVHTQMQQKYAAETDPAKRNKLVGQMNKINALMQKWPEMTGAVQKAQGDLGNWIEGTGIKKQADKALQALGKAINPSSIASEITALLGDLAGIDKNKLDKLSKDLNDICGLLPTQPADLKTTLTGAANAYAEGLIDKAVDKLEGILRELLQNAIGKLTGAAKQAAQDALGKLNAGNLGGALDAATNGNLDDAIGGLGGVDGLVDPSSLTNGLPGLDNIPGLGAGGVGNGIPTPQLPDNFPTDPSVGDLTAAGATMPALGPGFGLLCKMKIPEIPLVRRGEEIKCPTVECDDNIIKKGPFSGSRQFAERVERYFTYTPPENNRQAYLDKDLHDYDLTIPGERTRPAASPMQPGDAKCGILSQLGLGDSNADSVVNEPCQDNRLRDMCLLHKMDVDVEHQLTKDKVRDNEEPLGGVQGSHPIYDKNSEQLNCLVPKNTERISPLEFDNGWRYRDMCPGSKQLRRVERNGGEDISDLFRGEFGCLAPLPKCNIKRDWKLGTVNWKNQEFGTYMNAFGNAVTSTIGALFGKESIRRKLKQILSKEQFDHIKTLMKPKKSAAAECKPAYWVRLMLDSCANQYILKNALKAKQVSISDGRKLGLSPRFCQPFRIKKVPLWEQEYKVRDYVMRSYDGLLINDYMPWIKYDRHREYQKLSLRGQALKQPPEKNKFGKKSEKYRKNNWPKRQITWPVRAKEKNVRDRVKMGLLANPSINDYAAYPVERIIDPLHPFSPRYDIAEWTDGELMTDRSLFTGETESEAKRPKVWGVYPANLPLLAGRLKKYFCVPPKKKEGYWEFGCSIYCSAVEVDLLRFRYKDYNLCMGCQINTNEKAFWEEYEINRAYYKKEYCNPLQVKDECEYGSEEDKEICSACGKRIKHVALLATYTATCALTGAMCDEIQEQVKKIAIYTEGCQKCKRGAEGEALERARARTNVKEEPEWGPTAMGKNWPVCSTRFDHKGDPDLCKQAKEEYGCDEIGEVAEDDPNIARDATSDAKKCVKKSYKDICHDAAKPVYSVNFLKVRTRKGDFRTDDDKARFTVSTTGNFKDKVEEWRTKYADEDPAVGYGFREYFGNRRPYMRWWDTGREAFQVKQRPDYWCDWGQNDAIMGVGRDYNSIHGRKSQLCRYGGGGGIGDSCFTVKNWSEGKDKDGNDIPQDRRFPSLAGSEWAELKMYQANCFRNDGLNCLCQYEKTMKKYGPEDKILKKMGTKLKFPEELQEEIAGEKAAQNALAGHYWPLSWRGYISTPPNRDTQETSPAISTNQQFPYAYGDPALGSIIYGGLDKAQKGDVVIWPTGTGTLPMLGLVEEVNNLAIYGDIDKVPNKARWVRVGDSNNGKYLDACGNSSLMGVGPARVIYPNKDEMQQDMREMIEEQVTATYYCDDPELGHCVERRWNTLKLWRPGKEPGRKVDD